MHRTLQDIKKIIDHLIEQQGADASCAAFIFTKEDVFVVNDDCEQVRFSEEITNKVLNDLDETDYLLEQAFGCIEDYSNGYIKEIGDYNNGYIKEHTK